EIRCLIEFHYKNEIYRPQSKVITVKALGKSEKSTDWSGNTKKAPSLALFMPERNLHHRRRQP
ncbi:hypothetical protein, partial [Cronobacter sakazakii]|uniref:hypothetical protein n=1 Tax=Cronobacter sakazakii TaxID=28141 RepID=UPI001F323AF1